MFAVEKFVVKQDSFSVAKQMVKAQGKRVKSIGSGSYGEVYADKGSDVVYKIGDAGDNDGYLAFIKVLGTQKKHNPFLPKIYGVRFIRGKSGDHTFVVAMERLTSLERGMGNVCDWFEDELNGGYSLSYNANHVEKVLGVKKTMPKPLKEALSVLRKARNSGGYNVDWDLHSGNFMMRGKQIVVTDPLA